MISPSPVPRSSWPQARDPRPRSAPGFCSLPPPCRRQRSIGERRMAPKVARHSTMFVNPQWKLCLSSAHLCSGSLMVWQSTQQMVPRSRIPRSTSHCSYPLCDVRSCHATLRHVMPCISCQSVCQQCTVGSHNLGLQTITCLPAMYGQFSRRTAMRTPAAAAPAFCCRSAPPRRSPDAITTLESPPPSLARYLLKFKG